MDSISDRFLKAGFEAAFGVKPFSRRLLLAFPIVMAGMIGAILSFTAFHFVWRFENGISQKDLAAVTESHALARNNIETFSSGSANSAFGLPSMTLEPDTHLSII